MIISNDGKYIAFPSADNGQFQILDVTTGTFGRVSSTAEEGQIHALSPDGSRYVTIDGSRTLRLWDRQTGVQLADTTATGYFFVDSPANPKVTFTPDGSRVVALRYDYESAAPESVVVLDARTLEPLGDPVRIGSDARAIGVAPDGRTAVVVTSSNDTNVSLVDLETRQLVKRTLVKPGSQSICCARNNTISADGRTVGVGNNFGYAVVVDAVDGHVGEAIHAHTEFTESVTVAPDHSALVTTDRTGLANLWDASQKLTASFMPLGNHRLRAMFVAPDRVLFASDRGDLLEWDPRPDAWVDYACNVAGRNLTQAEWADVLPDEPYHVTCPQVPAGT
jgi:WD40 repeat protein